MLERILLHETWTRIPIKFDEMNCFDVKYIYILTELAYQYERYMVLETEDGSNSTIQQLVFKSPSCQ